MTGQKISHYQIESQLGEGGMGVVYRARDERLQRSVAIKLLPSRVAANRSLRGRVLAEARAASALNHPGIITIYEVGEEGETLFIVMELVEGKNLRQMISEGVVEPRMLARLGTQVADALSAAHQQGIVHGDIKPENIVILSDGRVKLLDFGVARQIAAEAAETMTITIERPGPLETPDSHIAGTLAYMAPEMLCNQLADARADLFSLGVLFYEMAAGRRPFPGPTSTALVAQIVNDMPAPLAAVPGVPPDLSRIIHKLLEKRPESRYQSAREVQVDLTNFVRDLELGAHPPEVAGKRAVAVLPFKLLTPNPDDEYLSVALADAVVNHLGASGDLLLRPTSMVMRYAKQTVDPLVAARELNVQVIVDGSIQKFGQRLRVHVQAWNAADGSTLLSAKQDSDMADLFGLQDRIASVLAKSLGMRAPSETAAPATPPTKNPVAYELFLRGVERLTRLNRWDLRTAVEMLENATELDPRFADAWARLAEACTRLGTSIEPDARWIRKAEIAIRRALALDSNNAVVQCARAQILWTPGKRYQNRPALRALGLALDLNPGSAEVLIWRGLILLHIGLHDDARAVLTEALARAPEDPRALVFLGQVDLYRKEYATSEEYHARATAADPGNIYANLFSPMVPLYSGQLDRAEAKIKGAFQLFPNDPMLTSFEALLWAKRGEKRKALACLERTARGEKSLLHSHHAWHNAAAAYTMLGKTAQAMTLLKRAGSHGLPNYPLFRDDPHFQPLQKNPQFLRLLATLKREWQSYQREFGAA